MRRLNQAKMIPTQIHMLKRVEYSEGEIAYVAHESTEYDCVIIGGDVCVKVDGVAFLVNPGEFEVVEESYELQMNGGKTTIVSVEDYPHVSMYTWYANKDSHNFYAKTNITTNGRKTIIALHRLIMADACDGKMIDHRNHNTLDNRRKNLRIATAAQNCANRRGNSRNTSGYRGVSFHSTRKKFVAAITFENKSHWIGEFNTAEEAHAAYQKRAKILFGEFANEVRYERSV